MKNTGRGAMRPTRSSRLSGGRRSWSTAFVRSRTPYESAVGSLSSASASSTSSAIAATVVDQDAVAVAGEHPRLAPRARAAGEDDDRGAVARRDVPALELEA